MSLDIDYMVDVVLSLPVLVNVVSLDVDTLTGDLYYADTVEDVLMRSSMDGMNVKQIFSESMDSVDGLVIDSIGRKVIYEIKFYLNEFFGHAHFICVISDLLDGCWPTFD